MNDFEVLHSSENDPTTEARRAVFKIANIMRGMVEPLDERNYEGTGHCETERTAVSVAVERDGFTGAVLFSRTYDPTKNPDADTGTDEEILVAGVKEDAIVFYHSQRDSLSLERPGMSGDSRAVIQSLNAVVAHLAEV